MTVEARAGEGRTDPAKMWFDRLHRSFLGESDRAAGIVAASMIEATLAELVTKSLLPVKSGARPIRARFLGESIGAAEQLGLISTQFAKDLATIQEIRNFFAHHPDSAGFRDPRVSGLVDRLKRAHFATVPEVDWRNVSGPRGDFLICVSWMLWSVSINVEEPTVPFERPSEFGYWPNAARAAYEAAEVNAKVFK